MKLAEALAERASIQTRLSELQSRLSQVVLVQEGDEPVESPAQLMAEVDRLYVRLEWLMRAINLTNAQTPFDAQRTITDAIAARDVAVRRQRYLAATASAATPSGGRYGHSEIRHVPTVVVADLLVSADEAAKRYRTLDTQLQALNWSTDLVEPPH